MAIPGPHPDRQARLWNAAVQRAQHDSIIEHMSMLVEVLAIGSVFNLALLGFTGRTISYHRSQLWLLDYDCWEVDCNTCAGIQRSNIQQAQQLNFSGVAALGSIWSSASPADATSELLEACAVLR